MKKIFLSLFLCFAALTCQADSYTKLLLHCDGTDGSTTFTDSSGQGHSVTAVGDAQVDTDYFKYPTGSALFDGTGDYLSVADSDDWYFADGDFTIDFWWRPASLGSQCFISQNPDGLHYWLIRYETSSGHLRIFTNDGGTATGDFYCSPSFSVDTWYHIEVNRSGSSCYMFVNGVSQSVTQATAWGTLPNISSPLLIGAMYPPSPEQFMDGRIDEIRVSKGIARHTANFTPELYPYYDFVPKIID